MVCAVLAVLPGAKGLYSNWELGQQSIRGASELTPNLMPMVQLRRNLLDWIKIMRLLGAMVRWNC